MAISWIDYCKALNPLIQKYGAIHYSQDDIKNGYFYWKSKNIADLIDEINRSVSFNQPISLVSPQDRLKRPDRRYYQHETYHQTEGALSRFLEANKVSSLIELLDKERNKYKK